MNQPESVSPTAPLRPLVSIVVPCYDEEDVLERTVTRLIEEFVHREIPVEMVMVDNGSSDRTGEIIDAMMQRGLPVTKQVIQVNQGYGLGVRTGLAAATAPLVGIQPADGQVDPRDVVQLAEVLLSSKTPKLGKVRRRFRLDGLWRKFVSTFYNLLTNVMYGGLGSIDINGSPKLFPRECLEEWALESDDWFLDAEILIKAKRSGLDVFEQNVFSQMREGGTSNVGATTIWEFLANLGYWRVFGKARIPGQSVSFARKPVAQVEPTTGESS